LGRIAERAQQMREREQERRQIRGETHPSLLPRPVPDPMEPLFAAINRGEDPFDDYPGTPAPEAEGESLYSPVNSNGGESSATAAARSPADAEPRAAGEDGLYFPVNSSANASEEPPPGAADADAGDSRALQGDAAVDHQLEAGDVAALLAREVDGRPGDV